MAAPKDGRASVLLAAGGGWGQPVTPVTPEGERMNQVGRASVLLAAGGG